jgi:hypothetical protein
MAASEVGTKRRWFTAMAGATLLVALAALLFRAPTPPKPQPRPEGPPIVVAPRPPAELAMHDLKPLFLPTPYNAAPREFRPPEPGRAYFDRDATMLRFDVDHPAITQPPATPVPSRPAQALADVAGPLALGFGRTDVEGVRRPPSGGHVDVFASGERDSVLGVVLPPEARPKSPLPWKPLEFAAVVDAGGLVGPLVVTAGSGVEEIDEHFRNYLARNFRIGDRLSPGFYRVVVGP